MELILRCRAFARLGFQTRILLLSTVLFGLLVAFRIHGSSVALLTAAWSPSEVDEHALAAPVLKRMAPERARAWRSSLLATPSWIRVDEFAQATPWAFAQDSHRPAFPVINRNMGAGQNMLLVWSAPVLHLAALVRPVTWGYLLLGTQAGLAWSWWFPVFSCFGALMMLIEILLPGRRLLGVFGALWYCASAYVVCWSLWPAYFTALGIWALVSAVRLLRSSRRGERIAWGALLGLSFSGFALLIYPPWQVPLGLTLLCLFIGLSLRDRLLENWRAALLPVSLAALVAALMLGSFYWSAEEALRALANTIYPGARRLRGGDCSFARLAGAFYNYQTIQVAPKTLNPSEAAGFFLLFPAAIIAGAVSASVRRRLGVIGWSLAGLGAFFVYFCLQPIPGWLAAITLLSRVQGFRAQIALGLVSVLLCVLLVDAASERRWRSRGPLLRAGAVFLGSALIFFWGGVEFQKTYRYFPGGSWAPLPTIVVSLGAAATSAILALGLRKLSATILLSACLLGSWGFNPLSSGFSPWQESDMGRALERVKSGTDPSPERPLWLTFGGAQFPGVGTVAQVMGVRTFAGVHHHPQLELWRPLDPSGKDQDKYNRFAHISLVPLPASRTDIVFKTPPYFGLHVYASPLNPAFRQLGASYVLSQGAMPILKDPRLVLMEGSLAGPFAILQLAVPSP